MKLPKLTVHALGVALALLVLSGAPLGCSNCDVEIATPFLPTGRAGVLYSFQVVSDCGGDFWFVSDGTLPPGIGLLDNGILRGVPLRAGTSIFTLGVVDSDTGGTAFKGFSLSIDPPL